MVWVYVASKGDKNLTVAHIPFDPALVPTIRDHTRSQQKELFPSWSFPCLYLQKNPDTVAELVLELYGTFHAPEK